MKLVSRSVKRSSVGALVQHMLIAIARWIGDAPGASSFGPQAGLGVGGPNECASALALQYHVCSF